MTRVSLKEAYDNKDVIAQIYAIRDTAESAVDTSEQAVTTANTASDHVDALVPQVEGAIANANSASASAQTSAQTVAGYENRLGAVEGDVVQLNTDVDGVENDLNAVTLRVTTAEGNIVTIQGRVTALETADGQNVKINRINDYAVGLTGMQDVSGIKRYLDNVTQKNVSTPGASSPSSYVATRESFRITGNDDVTIAGIGFEKSTVDSARIVFRINANLNPVTGKTPSGELHFILNENSGNLTLQPAHIDKDGVRTFGTAQTLMTWAV